jgi:hypothetical protein
MKKNVKRKKKHLVSIFSSFAEENAAEHKRLANLSPEKRLAEYGVLQQRAWGSKWTRGRISRTATVERTVW